MTAADPFIVIQRGELDSPWPGRPTLHWPRSAAQPELSNAQHWRLQHNEHWQLCSTRDDRLSFTIINATKAWRARNTLNLPSNGQHLVLSDCGESAGEWHDGPLALLTFGNVCHWITSGGPAALKLNLNQRSAIAADSPSPHVADGEASQRDRRWLTAWLNQSWPQDSALELTQLDQTQALILALAASSKRAAPLLVRHEELPVGKTNPPTRDWPQPWPQLAKRLGLLPAQHLCPGVRLDPLRQALLALDLNALREAVNQSELRLSDRNWRSLSSNP